MVYAGCILGLTFATGGVWGASRIETPVTMHLHREGGKEKGYQLERRPSSGFAAAVRRGLTVNTFACTVHGEER